VPVLVRGHCGQRGAEPDDLCAGTRLPAWAPGTGSLLGRWELAAGQVGNQGGVGAVAGDRGTACCQDWIAGEGEGPRSRASGGWRPLPRRGARGRAAGRCGARVLMIYLQVWPGMWRYAVPGA
jgi:hypothetical protein